MKGDFSRNSFVANKHYRGVRMQQGRVQMDADWNEQIDIADYRDRLFTEDFLGDALGPVNDAGFAIGVTTDTTTQQDLTIGLGRYYVNGLLLENSSSLYFTQQTDYPQATLPTEDGVYLAYLDVWQRNLSVADDPDIAESVLGDADTATRLYTVAQVKLMPAETDSTDTSLTYNELFNPAAAIDSAAYNNAQKWNALSGRLPAIVSATQLLPDVATLNANDIVYWIQIHQGGGRGIATYKFSTDNPLVEMNVNAMDNSNNTITLTTQPLDGRPDFDVGQWLELTTLKRDAAKLPGDMRQITSISGDEKVGFTIALNGGIATDITIDNGALIRRWQKNCIPVTENPQYLPESGLNIYFIGNAFETGSYWQMVVNNNALHWPLNNNGQFIALPPHSTTISQLTPSVSNSSLQNQLYRVEIHQGSGSIDNQGKPIPTSFKWSRDNASVSSRISSISNNFIVLETLPQDGINGFMLNQWLELTTPTRELIGKPGDMVQITNVNGATLTVNGSISSDITVANQAIVRRWDTAVTNDSCQAVIDIDVNKLLPLENGLSITFSGNDFQSGDYWLIPARTTTNNQGSHIEWPTDSYGSYLSQLPDGIQHSYAPLAIVQRSDDMWIFENDARTIAIPLSDLNSKVIGTDPCAPADTIHVDCNGQVGISTDTPTAKLDVQINSGMTGQDGIHATAAEGYAAYFTNNSATVPTLHADNFGDNGAVELFSNGTKPTLFMHNTGNGVGVEAIAETANAAYFFNKSSTSPTLYAENNGSCYAAYFANHSDDPTQSTLIVSNSGSGGGVRVNANSGGALSLFNNSSDYPALYINNNGSHSGMEVVVESGCAAVLENNSSINPGLLVQTTGSGGGISVIADSGFAAILENNSSTSPGLIVQNAGSGGGIRVDANSGGALGLFNNSNDYPALYINNNGSHSGMEVVVESGYAAVLENNSSINPGLLVQNTGSGGGIRVDANSGGALGLFNNSSDYPTLYINNNGSHSGMEVVVENGYAAALENNSSINPGLLVQNNGGHMATQLINGSTTNTTLLVENVGTDTYSAAQLFNNNPNLTPNAATLYVVNSAWKDSPAYAIYAEGITFNSVGTSTFSHLPIKENQHRIVTSPLTTEIEIYLSGSAQLVNGIADIDLEEQAALIYHDEQHPYKVLLTPLDDWAPLVVINKKTSGFTVTDKTNPDGHTAFDWFIIARKPIINKAGEKIPQMMPDFL